MAFGTPRSYHHKYKFLVDIDGFGFAGFQKCSELGVEVAVTEYHEGGAMLAHKSPGRAKIPDITLERGATADQDLWDWMSEVVDLTAQTGLTDPAFRKNGDVVQLDRDGTELRRWNCTNMFPMKFVAGDWDNESDDLVIEKATLSVSGLGLNRGQ
jgi:phage tail-like protein